MELCVGMLGLYVDYSISAVGLKYVMWQVYLFRVHASNVQCMYIFAFGHIVHCSEFL